MAAESVRNENTNPTPPPPDSLPLRTWDIRIIGLGAYFIIFTVFCLLNIVQLSSTEITPQTANEAQTQTVPEASATTEATAEATPEAPDTNASAGEAGAGSAAEPPATPPAYQLLFWSIPLTVESRLLLLMLFSGMLGGLVHDMRSYKWYVGNRNFVESWIPFYVLQPFIGAALAIVFYLIIRGGFFTPTSLDEANPFGFFAVGGLIGLFSEQALEKLKEIAATVFATVPRGADHEPPQPERNQQTTNNPGERAAEEEE